MVLLVLASTGLFLVDSIASFINFSYNVFDGAKGILKSIGGDNLERPLVTSWVPLITLLMY